MQILGIINHTFALFIEIAVLVAFWKFAAHNTENFYLGAFAGVILMTIAILLWARFAAPTSATRLVGPLLPVFKGAMFFVACLAFWGSGLPLWAGVLAISSVFHLTLAVWLGIL